MNQTQAFTPLAESAEQAPETALLLATAQGDAESFTELSRLVEPLIYGAALQILKNPDDARDVAQDVLLQIWKKAPEYRAELGKPRTWIAVLARNRAIDRLRYFQRRAAARDQIEQEVYAERVETNDAGEEAQLSERRQIVRNAVMDLPREQREAIFLAYYHGLTQTSIAERTSTPLGTVKSRIRYGIRRLQSATLGRI